MKGKSYNLKKVLFVSVLEKEKINTKIMRFDNKSY